MNPGFIITVGLPFFLGVMSLYFFAMGLRGVVTRKPFVIASRWFLGLVLLGMAPSLLQPFLFPIPSPGDFDRMLAIIWVTPVTIMLVKLFKMQEYMAFAVTDASFREGLLASLKKLELPHEETRAALRLPSVGADLQVAVQSWIGTGQLKMKQRQLGGLLRDIAKGMNEYYRSSTVPVNLNGCKFCVLMGVFLVIGVLVLVGAGGGIFHFNSEPQIVFNTTSPDGSWSVVIIGKRQTFSDLYEISIQVYDYGASANDNPDGSRGVINLTTLDNAMKTHVVSFIDNKTAKVTLSQGYRTIEKGGGGSMHYEE